MCVMKYETRARLSRRNERRLNEMSTKQTRVHKNAENGIGGGGRGNKNKNRALDGGGRGEMTRTRRWQRWDDARRRALASFTTAATFGRMRGRARHYYHRANHTAASTTYKSSRTFSVRQLNNVVQILRIAVVVNALRWKQNMYTGRRR